MTPLIENQPASIKLSENTLVLSILARSAQEKNFLIERIRELADQTFNMILKTQNTNKKKITLLMRNEAKIVYLKNEQDFSQKLSERPEEIMSSEYSQNYLVLSDLPENYITEIKSKIKKCFLKITIINSQATESEEYFLLKPPKQPDPGLLEKTKAFFKDNIKLISKVVIVLFVLLASLLSPTIRNIPLRIHEAIRRKTS